MYHINMLDKQGYQVIFHSEFAFSLRGAMEWVERMREWARGQYPYAHSITLRLNGVLVATYPVWV